METWEYRIGFRGQWIEAKDPFKDISEEDFDWDKIVRSWGYTHECIFGNEDGGLFGKLYVHNPLSEVRKDWEYMIEFMCTGHGIALILIFDAPSLLEFINKYLMALDLNDLNYFLKEIVKYDKKSFSSYFPVKNIEDV